MEDGGKTMGWWAGKYKYKMKDITDSRWALPGRRVIFNVLQLLVATFSCVTSLPCWVPGFLEVLTLLVISKSIGFSVMSLILWNSLPGEIWMGSLQEVFKAELFRRTFWRWIFGQWIPIYHSFNFIVNIWFYWLFCEADLLICYVFWF